MMIILFFIMDFLKKDLKFSYKENIIEVRVLIETLQEIGTEREIQINQEILDGSEQSV